MARKRSLATADARSPMARIRSLALLAVAAAQTIRIDWASEAAGSAPHLVDLENQVDESEPSEADLYEDAWWAGGHGEDTEADWFGSSTTVRASRPESVQYEIGQVYTHSTSGARGVITGGMNARGRLAAGSRAMPVSSARRSRGCTRRTTRSSKSSTAISCSATLSATGSASTSRLRRRCAIPTSIDSFAALPTAATCRSGGSRSGTR